MFHKIFRQRMYRQSKIFISILQSIVLIIPIPIIFIILIELVSLRQIERTVDEFEKKTMERVLAEVDQSFYAAHTVITQVKQNEMILNYVKADERNYYQEWEVLRELRKIWSGYGNIDEIYMYFPQFNYVISTSFGMDSFDYHMKYYKNSYDDWIAMMDGSWHGKFQTVLGKDNENENILSTSIVGREGEPSVQVVLRLNNNYLKNIINTLCVEQVEEAFICSDMGLIVSTYKGEGEGLYELCGEHRGYSKYDGMLDGKRYSFRSAVSSKSGMTLILATPHGMKHEAVRYIKLFGVLVSAGGSIVLLIFAIAAAYKNYKPIDYLFSTINEYENGMIVQDYGELQSYVKKSLDTRAVLGKKVKEYEKDVIGFCLTKALFMENARTQSMETMKQWGFSGQYYIILLCVIEGSETINDLEVTSDEGGNVWREDILSAYIKDYFPDVTKYSIISQAENFYCILNGNGCVGEDFKRTVIRQADLMKKDMEELEGVLTETYISECSGTTADLHKGYELVNAKRKDQVNREIGDEKGNCTVESITEIIQKNLSDVNLSVNVIADQLSISPSHLSRFFKSRMGIGVLEYIHGRRIELAKNLLGGGNTLTVKEVASATGFYNVSTFIRVFKKVEGVTPGQYRYTKLN